MNEYDAIGSAGRQSRGVGGVATVALAAAVGAGVALLFTTDAGARTRQRMAGRIRDLELGERAGRAGHAARESLDSIRHRSARRIRRYRRPPPERDSNSALYATLGTVAGAALAALLTPQGGRETRDWIGNTFDDIRQNASLKWKEHRARKKAEPTDEAVRRLEGNGHEEWDEAGIRD